MGRVHSHSHTIAEGEGSNVHERAEAAAPIECSRLGGRVSDLAAAGGGIGAAVGAYATGDPLVLLAVPAGIVACGAAHGVADALRIGLRARLLRLLGVEEPAPSPNDSLKTSA